MFMFDWEPFHSQIVMFKDDIIRESKRAIKKQVPKSQIIRDEIRDNLIDKFNAFSKYCWLKWSYCDQRQQYVITQTFVVIRDKTVNAFNFLGVDYIIPRSLGKQISSDQVDPNFINIYLSDEMATFTVIDFFNLASKLLPTEYSGEPEKLQSVLDALRLLKTNAGEYEPQAVAFVKTKLIGKARRVIEDSTTIQQIIETLKTHIKTESSAILVGKLLNTNSKNKSTENYLKDIEQLTTKLQQAYISEGVPENTSRNYTRDTVVKALTQNASSEKLKLVMEVGSFPTAEDAIAKFSTIKPDNNSTIFLMRGNPNNQYNRFRGARGRGYYNNFQNNYNRPGQFQSFRNFSYNPRFPSNNVNNNYSYQRGNNGNFRGQRFNNIRNNYEQPRGSASGNRYNGNYNIRFCSTDPQGSENMPDPGDNTWGAQTNLGLSDQ